MLARIKFEIGGLVREIVERLPAEVFTSTETTFLDPAMAGGQFLVEIIRKLRDNGHSDDNIASRVFGLAEDRLDLNYAQRKNGVIGQLAVGGIETLENYKNMGKKFDVVIGNPPYQDAGNKNARMVLWPKFIEKAFDLCMSGGIVALVTPKSWTTSGDMYTTFFVSKQAIAINLDECAKHFPGVGSTFSYFVVKNASNAGDVITVTTSSGSYTTTQLPLYGIEHGLVAAAIISKTSALGDFFDVMSSSGYNSSKFSTGDKSVSKVQTSTHPYQVLHGTKKGVDQFFYSSLLDLTEHGVPRVIMSIWVANYDKMRVSDSLLTSQDYRHFPAATMQEAHNLHGVLQSKLYKFIARTVATTSRFSNASVARFPKVDLTRSWTDQELYAHFNLTQEEIDLIEATVK